MTTLLSELTTMRVGGPAERILQATTKAELIEHALELWGTGDPWLLLGGGSNTVVCDEGFPGAVLLVRNQGVDRVVDQSLEGAVRIRVQAGQEWDALVAFCVEQGWSGIEALSGIPGLAGAAPVQNIGAYGAELSDVLSSIEFLDAETGEVARLTAAELHLGYRTSSLKEGREGVVLSLDLVLQIDEEGLSAPIAYSQLANALGVEIGTRVPLKEVRETVLRLRAEKGMVLDPDDHDSWSAGSFFTNPIVSEQFAQTLPEDAPRFAATRSEPNAIAISLEDLAAGEPIPTPEAEPQSEAPKVKLSAAWLIENSGIRKGFRIPGSGAAISSKHTLALTNQRNASAEDVAQLARFVVQRVQQEFGVVLVPEPNLYGLEL